MSYEPLTQQQITQAENQVSSLKVAELQKLLEGTHQRKGGNKQDLIIRLHSLLKSVPHQRVIYERLQEMRRGASNRQVPYPIPGRSYGAPSFSSNSQMRGYGGIGNGYPGGSTMHSAQNLVNQNQRIVQAPKDLVTVPLPFCDVIDTLLDPVELSASPGGQRQQMKQVVSFSLSDEQARSISYRMDSKALPRYEIQMRFFNTSELAKPQKDDFPQNCSVRLDDMIVTLPNVIPTNKPNVEPKRLSRPVCLTQYCQKNPRVRPNAHRLFIEWSGDKRTWAFAVYYVFRVNSDMLRERMIINAGQRQEIEQTRRQIIRRLAGDDEDGIAMDQLKIGLLCPLSKIRMTLPARCRDCIHLQCFDLNSYLQMNEKRPTWNCPVCSGYAPYDRLIIDEYFKDVIVKVDSQTTEVELKEDGRFEVLKNDEGIELSSDDDGVGVVKKEVKESICGPPPKVVPTEDVITLSDSEDEMTNRAIMNSMRTESTAGSEGPSSVSRVDTYSNPSSVQSSVAPSSKPPKAGGIEIITLDDTPPRPSPPPRDPERLRMTIPMDKLTSSPSSSSAVPPPQQSRMTLRETLERLRSSSPPSPPSVQRMREVVQQPLPQATQSNLMMPRHVAPTSSAGYSSFHQYGTGWPDQQASANNLIGRQMSNVMAPMQPFGYGHTNLSVSMMQQGPQEQMMMNKIDLSGTANLLDIPLPTGKPDCHISYSQQPTFYGMAQRKLPNPPPLPNKGLRNVSQQPNLPPMSTNGRPPLPKYDGVEPPIDPPTPPTPPSNFNRTSDANVTVRTLKR